MCTSGLKDVEAIVNHGEIMVHQMIQMLNHALSADRMWEVQLMVALWIPIAWPRDRMKSDILAPGAPIDIQYDI